MILIVAGLVVVSILLSLWSLWGLLKSSKEVVSAKKELYKNRVVYQSDSPLVSRE